ncbi:MAG: hypothetical protein ACYC2U_07300 [Candidatus Amoebophilus sp.]
MRDILIYITQKKEEEKPEKLAKRKRKKRLVFKAFKRGLVKDLEYKKILPARSKGGDFLRS